MTRAEPRVVEDIPYLETGARLRSERKRLGLNQSDFGVTGNVTKQAQLRYEKGERSPNAEYLQAISKAGADVQFIVTGFPTDQAQSADERSMLEAYRNAPKALKVAVLAALASVDAIS